ncbi:MAG: 6-phosphogluconolactonase [Thermoleophilia bacterium]|nr:6-phosphogluconolactonase [Thermoleophilia bacterium]
MKKAEVRVLADPWRAAAELVADVARRGRHVALSGGSTVGRAYSAAAELQPDWSRIEIWFGDDRAVPTDDERSNFRLVRETLLDRLAAAPAAVHRVKGELGAREAAVRYDAALEGVTLSLALNGLGPDGHTASLFPGAPALRERRRRAVAAEPALEPWVPRVTMTPHMFAAAELLVYLVTGAEKADAVRRAFAGEPGPATPASLVRGRRTIALLDEPAGQALG